jgi:hypothetical protein
LPFLLQRFDPGIEPCQGDVVVKIQQVSDLLVNVLTCGGDLFVALLAGACETLPQLVEFRRVLRVLGNVQKQAAGIGGFLDRADVSLSERDVGGKIIVVDYDELVIDGAGHAHAQECDRRHQNQKPDGDAKDLDPDGNAHDRLQSGSTPADHVTPGARTCGVLYPCDVLA